jgi:nitroreductase
MKCESFLDLAARRWSCRAYDPERAVDRDTLEYCLEAARAAPSACNRQPWRFVVITDPARRSAVCRSAGLPGIANDWWSQAPVLIVLAYERSLLCHRIASTVSRIPYHFIDLGIAGQQLVLAAAEQGLGSCWIGWVNGRALKRLLGMPRSIGIGGIITIGYPAESPPQERRRMALNEIVHWQEWRAPAPAP